MINKHVEKAINEQIAKEMFSANLYLAMSAFYKAKNLNGFANWMRVQAQEESAHAMIFFDYLIERGGEVRLSAIDAPQSEWSTPLAAFEAAYAHEQHITASINAIAEVAMQEKDFATTTFLQWFITEQVEEEATVLKILNQLRMIEGKGPGLFMLDREMGQRISNVNLENPEQTTN